MRFYKLSPYRVQGVDFLSYRQALTSLSVGYRNSDTSAASLNQNNTGSGNRDDREGCAKNAVLSMVNLALNLYCFEY